MSDREDFYGRFMRHSVDGALQEISEAYEDVGGSPLPSAARERVTGILLDWLGEFQRASPRALSPFDEALASRIVEASTGDVELAHRMKRPALDAVVRLIANFSESLARFLEEGGAMDITHTLVDDVLTLTPVTDRAVAWIRQKYFGNLENGSVRYAVNMDLEREQARRFIRRAREAGLDLGDLNV